MKQTIYILILALTYALLSGSMMVWLSRDALADSIEKQACEQMRDRYLQTGEGWHRKCGVKPIRLYDLELKKDCERTISKILARPGASWNNEGNWAPEERCWAFWPKEEHQ